MAALGPGLLRIFHVKTMLVNKDFQTWHLIGWQHSRQPIRSHVRKSLLTNMEFNMDFCLVTPSPEISMLKSLLVNKDFQTWHLIGWQHSRQPIRSHVRKSLLTNMEFNMDFCLVTPSPGAHFTNNFSITIQMWWKFHFAFIQILIKWSLQYLAHCTTAGLSCNVPNFVVIWSSVIELELNEISIEFELWWKNR